MSCDYLFDIISELEQATMPRRTTARGAKASKLHYLNGKLGKNDKQLESFVQCEDEDLREKFYASSINNSVGSISSLVRSKISNSLPSDDLANNCEEDTFCDSEVQAELTETEVQQTSSSHYSDETIGYRNTERLLSDLNQNLMSNQKSVCFRFEPSNSSLKKFTIRKEEQEPKATVAETSVKEKVKARSIESTTKKILKATLSKCSKLNTRYVRKQNSAASVNSGGLKRNDNNRVVKLLSSNQSSSCSMKSKRTRYKRRSSDLGEDE